MINIKKNVRLILCYSFLKISNDSGKFSKLINLQILKTFESSYDMTLYSGTKYGEKKSL